MALEENVQTVSVHYLTLNEMVDLDPVSKKNVLAQKLAPRYDCLLSTRTCTHIRLCVCVCMSVYVRTKKRQTSSNLNML